MQKRIVSPAGFLLALICFALPFVAVSCESPMGKVTASYSGGDMVFGGKPEVSGDLAGEGMPSDEADSPEEDGNDRMDPQPLAILAFLATIGGLALALVTAFRSQRLATLIAGAAAALLLILNQIVVRAKAVSELKKSDQIFAGAADDMVQTRFGFWLALTCLLAAVGFSAYEHRRERGLPGWPVPPRPQAPPGQGPGYPPPPPGPPG